MPFHQAWGDGELQEITLKRFSEISSQINSTEDIHDLLTLIMDTAKDLLDTEGSSLLLYDSKSDELIFDIVRGPKGNLLANQRLRAGEGIAGLVAQSKEALIVDDAAGDPRVSRKFDQKINFKTRNILAVPLMAVGKLIGVLEVVNSRNEQNFSEDDKEHLSYLSNQAAIAIYNRKLFQELENRMDELSCIYEISQTISSDFDFNRNVNNILKSICSSLAVERLSLIIGEEGGEDMKVISFIGFDMGKDQIVENIANGIAGFVYRSGNSLLVKDVKNDLPQSDFFSPGLYKTKSFVAIPIKHGGRVIGVLNATDKKQNVSFDSFDFRVLSTIGEQISEAFGNYKSHEEHLAMEQMKRDLETASLIQMNSLPHLAEKHGNLEIHYFYKSCEAVGGDFYDMIIHGEKLTSFIIGDVSGKGVGAALFMEHVKTLLQSYVPRFKNPRTSISELNRKILEEKRIVIFVTVMIVQIDTENNFFRYASAGHNNQFLIKAGSPKIEKLSGKGAPAGAFEEDKYEEFVTSYEEGDYLFLYTDGITEAMNEKNEIYGDERLMKTLGEMAGSLDLFTPKSFFEKILAGVQSFTGGAPLHDDQTALVVKL